MKKCMFVKGVKIKYYLRLRQMEYTRFLRVAAVEIKGISTHPNSSDLHTIFK